MYKERKVNENLFHCIFLRDLEGSYRKEPARMKRKTNTNIWKLLV
jgi:hypothetical protein